FDLPTIDGDFVLLTPKDILTKDETWINKADMVANFNGIANAIPNDQLRAQLNGYLARNLPVEPNKKTTTKLSYPQSLNILNTLTILLSLKKTPVKKLKILVS
ncbi:hypothetical protein CGG91_23785, partial [Vibrio parahaemolyticus]